MGSAVLVRYGTIPEVARFRANEVDSGLSRGDSVLVQSHRGLQLGTVLNLNPASSPRRATEGSGAGAAADDLPPVVRPASEDDLETAQRLGEQAAAAFPSWRQRIEQWQLELELVDLEWTLDGRKLILYVLNQRGPDCTRLALQAAAAGLGIIEVQPVSADGLVTLPAPDRSAGGGCGTCGCH